MNTQNNIDLYYTDSENEHIYISEEKDLADAHLYKQHKNLESFNVKVPIRDKL